MKDENWFEFRGERSTDYGLILRDGHSLGSPESNAEFVDIPGRNGPLILDDGTFKNYEDTYSCGLMTRSNVEDQARLVKSWLQSSRAYGYLRDWRDPDYYREATCTSKIDIQRAIEQLGYAVVVFNCKPFKKSLVGLEPVILSQPGMLYNPEAYGSLPYIKLVGNGNITIYINNRSIVLQDVSEFIEIDCEMKEAYKEPGNGQNDKLRSDWPYFDPGENNISWTGSVDHLEIIPRWEALAS
jgi:phage-related protein